MKSLKTVRVDEGAKIAVKGVHIVQLIQLYYGGGIGGKKRNLKKVLFCAKVCMIF